MNSKELYILAKDMAKEIKLREVTDHERVFREIQYIVSFLEGELSISALAALLGVTLVDLRDSGIQRFQRDD